MAGVVGHFASDPARPTMTTMGQAMTVNAAAEASAGELTPYAELRETHTGVVVLVANRAYKGKKPIKTDFLDFSTPARREQACAREVELNRRLAPDAYLGVACLSDPLGGPAEPVVVMRRYPDSGRLSAMVRSGAPMTGCLTRIAEKLSRFHDRADRSTVIDAEGKVGAVLGRWLANIAELKPFARTVVSTDPLHEISTLATLFVDGRSLLFETRIEERRIVDGHGDLLADDIFCSPGEVELLDCLEFNDQLRYVDAIDDAAFLAMDLEFLGTKDSADFFLHEYIKATGDPAPASLRHFYIAYRSVVRAKVDCIRFKQGNAAAAHDAARHLDIAVDHLRSGVVRLALVGGGPGTGKTTLATRLGERVGATVISTDAVRRELQESGSVSGAAGVLNRGLYSADSIAAVYDEVLRRAGSLLSSGHSVILDCTWRDPRQRARARELARETHSAIAEILCVASRQTVATRVAGRQSGDASDATPDIATALAFDHSQWREAVVVHTARPVADTVAYGEALWHDRVRPKPTTQGRKT